MTYRVQIITHNGEPMMDVRAWGETYAQAIKTLSLTDYRVMRWKEPDDRRWRYMIAGDRVQSTKELTEAFRVAGMYCEKGK